MSKTIKDIMTRSVISIANNSTMRDVHQLMKDNSIRHIPVVDSGRIEGVITQKTIIAKVMSLLDRFGASDLHEQEKQIPVSELLDKNVMFASGGMSLTEAASYFLSHRHGCLPVIDSESHLIGMVTSSDFVKLSLTLLQEGEYVG